MMWLKFDRDFETEVFLTFFNLDQLVIWRKSSYSGESTQHLRLLCLWQCRSWFSQFWRPQSDIASTDEGDERDWTWYRKYNLCKTIPSRRRLSLWARRHSPCKLPRGRPAAYNQKILCLTWYICHQQMFTSQSEWIWKFIIEWLSLHELVHLLLRPNVEGDVRNNKVVVRVDVWTTWFVNQAPITLQCVKC